MITDKNKVLDDIVSIKKENLVLTENAVKLKFNRDIFKKYHQYKPSEILYIYKTDTDILLNQMFCPVCGKKKEYTTRNNRPYQKYCSFSCRNKSKEYQTVRVATARKNWNKKTSEEKAEIHKRQQQNRVLSDSVKKIMSAKRKITVSEWTDEFKKSVFRKLSESLKKSWQNKTDEEKYLIGLRISESLHKKDNNNLTPIQKSQIKIKNTCLQKYGVDNVFKSREIKNKIRNTNIRKFGIDYPIQSHIKHIENVNSDYFANFIKNGQFDIDACCEYYNVKREFVNKKKLQFSILESNIHKRNIKQKEIFDFIRNIYNGTIILNDRKILKPLELDIFIPDKNVAIEFNGIFWHSHNAGTDKYYHRNKSLLCRQKGIRLIHVYEDEWDNKKDIIKDIIKHSLNIPVSETKIYARNCVIKEIDNNSYTDFCNKYHIQGAKSAQIKLGLFYNNSLVQIASFSKCRYDKKYEWEWIRGCPASNNNVIGGTSKLFAYFRKKYNPESVLCYADLNKFDGRGYNQCGFSLDKITVPDKFYYDLKNKKRINRNPNKYHLYISLVKQNKFLLLYGAGNMKFVWHKII